MPSLRPWVKLYRKASPEWDALPPSVQAMGEHFLRFTDDEWVLALPGRRAVHLEVGRLIGAEGNERRRLGPIIAILMEDGFLVPHERGLLIRSFVRIQNVPSASPASTQRAAGASPAGVQEVPSVSPGGAQRAPSVRPACAQVTPNPSESHDTGSESAGVYLALDKEREVDRDLDIEGGGERLAQADQARHGDPWRQAAREGFARGMDRVALAMPMDPDFKRLGAALSDEFSGLDVDGDREQVVAWVEAKARRWRTTRRDRQMRVRYFLEWYLAQPRAGSRARADQGAALSREEMAL